MNVSSCFACAAPLAAVTYKDRFLHNGHEIEVDELEKYICNSCGAGPLFADQVKRNQVKVADAKRHADGFLKSFELRRIRERLGLSQAAAARIFRGGEHAFSKYERGEVLQSYQMDRLIRLAIDVPEVLHCLAVYSGEELPNRHLVSNQGSSSQWLSNATVRNTRQVVALMTKAG